MSLSTTCLATFNRRWPYASTIADEIRTVCERWLATLDRLLTQPPVEDAGGLSAESAMFYRADFRILR